MSSDAAPVIIERLTADNAAKLLGTEIFDNPIRPDALAAFVADPGHELVFASIGRKLVGFASGTLLLHPDKPATLFVNEVGVDTEFRRKGIASTLCEHLIALARERGCEGIWLATEHDNTPARALYRKLLAHETPDIVVYDWDSAMPRA